MKLVITMSRRSGTGASQIAKTLSERLQIPVYDKTIVEEKLGDGSFETEAEVIKDLAQSSCIILGRCASEILQGRRNVFNIYVVAAKEDRIRRIMNVEGISYEEAKEKLEKTDAERAEYYFEHTGKTWGDVNNYHMILDTSEIGIDRCADVLMACFKRLEII